MGRMKSRHQRLLLLTACSVASGMIFSTRVWAQSAPAPVIVPSGPDTGGAPAPTIVGAPGATPGPTIVGGPSAATPESYAVHIQKIKKYYHALLLKEKNVAAAVSTVNKKQIEAEGTQQGSIQSLLKQTPSVNEYQQNIGQGVPVITVRGVRNSELASTLNGLIPLNDLLSGGQGAFLANNIGSPITLGQISGTTVYPGVAPPDKQGYGTVGGTIAYTSKEATPERYAKIFAGYGSFNTSNAGFELNTGNIGTGPNAPRALLRYNQSYTSGFPDNNNVRGGDMLFSFVKPYNDGLSHLSATVIYNRSDGYIVTAPLAVPLIQANSYSYNFPHSLTYTRQNNKYLTAILHDETYINPHLILSGSLFYLRQSSVFTSYQNPSTIQFNPAFPYQVTFQVPYFAYGQVGPGTPFYKPGYFTYNPSIFGAYQAGESAEVQHTGTKTIGFTPKANIFLPHNDITIGGLFAKETSLGGNAGASYMYGADPMPQTIGYNSFAFGGAFQRTLYTVYAQDRINLFHDRLHIEPGAKITGVFSNHTAAWSFLYNENQAFFGGVPPFPDTNGTYRVHNYGKFISPYLGISYDLPDHFVVYGSYGKDGRIGENNGNGQYLLSASGGKELAPNPEIIHSYEAGLRYDTPRLYLNADAYYQKITSAFSFYTNYQTGLSSFNNIGVEQFRGYETSGKYRLTHDIELFGNASFNQSNYLNQFYANDTPFQGQFGYVFKGNPLASIPNWLGNFGVEYDHGPFSARLSGQYTGQQVITGDLPPQLPANPVISPLGPNSTLALATVPFVPSAQANLANSLGGYPPIPHFRLPAYLLMNVLLSYKLPMHGYDHLQYLRFSLNVRNLLGLHYYQHYYLSPAEIPQGGGFALTPTYASAFQGIPRSIFLNVTAKF